MVSVQKRYIRKSLFGAPSSVSIRRPYDNFGTFWHLRNRSSYWYVTLMTFCTIFCANRNRIDTALHTSCKNLGDKADCIVGVYSDWVYNSNLIVRVYSHWVNTGICIVGVYRDWVYNTSLVALALWVYIRIGCIMRNWSLFYCEYIMRHILPALPETMSTATLVLVCETVWSSFSVL